MNKYNYSRHTVLFDLDDAEEKALFEWMNKRKTKKNSYSVQIKEALKKIKEENK